MAASEATKRVHTKKSAPPMAATGLLGPYLVRVGRSQSNYTLLPYCSDYARTYPFRTTTHPVSQQRRHEGTNGSDVPHAITDDADVKLNGADFVSPEKERPAAVPLLPLLRVPRQRES